MKVGYIRVSTDEQNTARQENALADCEKLFIDYCSGKNAKRPELEKMLAFVRAGDTVIVESFSRLARSMADLLHIVEFIQQKGAEIVSLKESFDTSTAAGRFQLALFAALAQFEREQMLERQREGIQAAKRQDAARREKGLKPLKYPGRKRIEFDQLDFQREYKRWKEGRQTAVYTMKQLNLKPGTFYRRVREYEAKEGGKE